MRASVLQDPRRLSSLVLGVLLATLAAGPALAGQQVQASIIGQVTDENGGVLPGVTVTATSPSLQVPSITEVTNERGEYRLTPLPIGVYAVDYTLTGFQTVRHETLRLTSGFVARVDVVLKIGGLAESINVTGQSPVVDVTTTALTTQFTRETLELAATPRNGLFSLLAQLPMVRIPRVGDSGMGVDNPGNVTKYGQTSGDWVVIEGVASQPDTWSGVYVDYSVWDEVKTEVIGADASQNAKGLKISIITKSGGNDFHGNYTLGYTNYHFQNDNLTDKLRSFGIRNVSKVLSRVDLGGDLGGRIVRDKLWFYGGLRRTYNLFTQAGVLMPDGSPAELRHMFRGGTGKVSYQPTPGNRFIGFYTIGARDTVEMTEFTPWESRADGLLRSPTRKIEWQGISGNALAVSLQYGKWHYISETPPSTTNPTTFDNVTMRFTGASFKNNSLVWRHHTKGSLTWYRPDLFAGNHELKTGFEYMDYSQNYLWPSRGASGNYEAIYTNGVPFQLLTVNAPVAPKNPARGVGIYGTDSWTVSRQLTLNLGLRYARDNAWVPAQCQEAGPYTAARCYEKVQFRIWNSLAPRLHAAYAIGADSKTVLKGGWGRYAQLRGNAAVILANRAAYTETTWRWTDLNNNRLYEAGEVNLDPNGPDFLSISGTTNMVPNPNDIQPKTDEFSLALDRELMANFAVRAAGIYHRVFDVQRLNNNKRPYSVYNIPITNRDPGPDGVAGNADDPGTSVTYFDFPAAYRGNAFVETMYVMDPGATQRFKTIELSATKRLSNRWQLIALYSATKKDIPYLTNTSGGYPVTTLDPNAEINTYDRTWDWSGGVSGAYIFPYEVMVSVNDRVISGAAFGRTVQFRGGVQIPSLVVRVEPIGTNRLDTVNIMDLKVEKTLRLSGNRRVGLKVNLSNVLNSSTVVRVSDRSGPTYLAPSYSGISQGEPVLRPRLATLDVSYAF